MPVYDTDRQLLETAITWLAQGHTPALVTVARTWGSSPRPVGSLMLMREDGLYTGSVSGGCVETDLVDRYQSHQLSDTFPTLVDYGVNREQATRLGLPCGGRLELLVEQLRSAAQLQILLDSMQRKKLITRRVCLSTGEVSLHAATAGEEFAYTQDYLKKIFGPEWDLLIIGAGHLSQYVAQLALMLNYRVIVCDPREEFVQDGLQDEIEFVRIMPDEAVQAYVNHPRGVVVALTHDPRLDDMALMDALNSQAFYVGALGSRRNSDQRRERLQSLGIAPHQLQRLHAPVGLAIGSRTPPEIALAIMAEITALRHAAGQKAHGAASAA